jgi:ribosomal protein L37AE/L43A
MLIDAAAEEWRRLTEQYRAMSDDQLRELAADFSDLTETAQQVLRSEMSSRGLGTPEAITASTNAVPVSSNARAKIIDVDEDSGTSDDDADGDTSGSHNYTWKTLLCECEEWKQAWQLGEALRRAGVDNWLQRPREFGLQDARVWVAADQLERARTIADRPIPQDIVDESNQPITEFRTPKCPKCGAEDPTLEAAEPTNTWLCEECGATWTDPEADSTTDSAGDPAAGAAGAENAASRALQTERAARQQGGSFLQGE